MQKALTTWVNIENVNSAYRGGTRVNSNAVTTSFPQVYLLLLRFGHEYSWKKTHDQKLLELTYIKRAVHSTSDQ